MSKFNVTASELQTVITSLSESNGQFRNRVNELVAKQQELTGQWQGDANVAFDTAFNADKGQWDTFIALVDQYVEALKQIKQIYETAEGTNTSTATTRTY